MYTGDDHLSVAGDGQAMNCVPYRTAVVVRSIADRRRTAPSWLINVIRRETSSSSHRIASRRRRRRPAAVIRSTESRLGEIERTCSADRQLRQTTARRRTMMSPLSTTTTQYNARKTHKYTTVIMGDVISSFRIYASCFTAMMRGKITVK